MRAVFLLGLLATISQASCAARAPVADGAKVSQRLEELAQKEASLQKLVEEMQNRLFLLEDKVDTSRVAIERSKAPELPVIRIRPRPAEGGGESQRASADASEDQGDEAAGAEEGEEVPVGGRSVVSRRSVILDGEARREGPRPVLRLHESGSGGGSSSTASIPGTLAGPDPASVNEKLPVVPLPKRSARLEAMAAPAAPPAQPGVQPMQVYQKALDKYRSGDYAAAAEAFKGFFRQYGQHAYADNALYWLAECSYDLKQYNVALKFFRQVVEQYPSGNKAPDALLKMAYCYMQMKDRRNARAILAQVVDSYPRSQVARLASEAIAKL